MAIGTINVEIKVRFLPVLKMINFPLTMLGYKPVVPRWFVTVGPSAVKKGV